MVNKTVYLHDYQPPAFSVDHISLNVDLYDDHALISSTMTLTREHPGLLVLYGDELELVRIEMNDKPLLADDYRFEDGHLIIDECPDHIYLHIVTRVKPQENTQLSGLYRSDSLFCTQCEAQGFRRITFYPDRPDVLSIFTTRITANKTQYPILLSNGNLRSTGDLPEGRHFALWSDPFKKPSYLFALVAGNLGCVEDYFQTASGRQVTLRLYVEPGNEAKCTHAMASLKKAMRWDETMYGREYDLDIYMIVAVSNFNMGAMENKGLNIFNDKYILVSPETAADSDFVDVESVVGHEYFHNWTGNRVTCRDWFQLSLKEGLTVFRDQEFTRDMQSREVNRIIDVKTLINTQFPEDAGSMAHPVRPESYQEIDNFYTATVYNKGAEVIRMQQTLLGKEGFRRGMDLYFERHDGQAVTIDDFVAAMADANQVDLTQFKRWYSQAGTPQVNITRQFSGDTLSLTMRQSCPPTPDGQLKQPFHIPIRLAFFDEQGQHLANYCDLIELKQTQETFQFSGFYHRPYVSILRDFSAPVNIVQDFDEEELLALLKFESNGYAKWQAVRQLVLRCLHALLKQADQTTWVIPYTLLEALQHILLDAHLDPALRAELLSPPSFEECAFGLESLDVALLEKVRRFYRRTLGQHLCDALTQQYQNLWTQEDHAMHADAFGRRKLRNICLELLMKSDEAATLPICQQQFNAAQTMSDQLASFALLCHAHTPEVHQQAVQAFYQQWSENHLVLDKWFSIQAMNEQPHTLARVQELLMHPAFSLKNPNRVRALIGTFVMYNLEQFHALDGSGYEFLTTQLLLLNKLNPQVAARLATPFTRWQRYDKPRKSLIQAQLIELSQHKLSKDLAELVSKSLIINKEI